MIPSLSLGTCTSCQYSNSTNEKRARAYLTQIKISDSPVIIDKRKFLLNIFSSLSYEPCISIYM